MGAHMKTKAMRAGTQSLNNLLVQQDFLYAFNNFYMVCGYEIPIIQLVSSHINFLMTAWVLKCFGIPRSVSIMA